MSEIAFIDFEAPALSGDVCPIEVGVAVWRSGGPIRTWSSLIRRQPDALWSEKAEKIHKIKRRELEDAPEPQTVAAALNSLLGPAGGAFCDGMPFDELWCRSLFRDAGLTMNFSVLPMEMLPLRDAHRMVSWLKSNKDIPHRAGPDALRLMRAYAYAFKERPPIEAIAYHE